MFNFHSASKECYDYFFYFKKGPISMKVRSDSDITCVGQNKPVSAKTILNDLITINMNILLTVTTFHMLHSVKANEASTSWKQNLLFPSLPPWIKPSLSKEIVQRNMR